MLLDKFVNSFSSMGNDAEYDDYDDSDYIVDEEPVSPKKETAPAEDERPKRSSVSKVSPIARNKKVQGNGMEVCVIKPTSVDDAREITETLLANRTVVLNLEGLDVNIAQRIIDFASGSTFAIDGSLQKISHYIFILTPASVDISGDIQGYFDGAFDVQ